MNKAEKLLKKEANVDKKAEAFVESAVRNIQKSFLDTLKDRRDNLQDKIASKLDFTLVVDLNKGQSPVTREEAERRFETALEAQYELKLVNIELETKQALFDDFFVTVVDED